MNLAYVAGFFDGEGCVNFCHLRSGVFPRVLITNTDRLVLEAIQSQFGGDINKLALRKPGWKQGYTLRISWTRAIGFLDKIRPWLIVKDRQADTVFAWDAIRAGGRKQTAACRAEYLDAAQLLCERMKWLNAKGELKSPDPIDAFT